MAKVSDSNTLQTTGEKAFTGIADLIKLLPTGTMFVFQMLNQLATNNGSCFPVNKLLHLLLVIVCGFACAFSCFTDSYVDKNRKTQYGIVTKKGLWPSSGTEDLSTYRLQISDFVHAAFSLLVFGVIVLVNANTINCYYPSFEETQKTLLMALPPVIGSISGAVFVVFPNTRHGIGYALSQTSQDFDAMHPQNHVLQTDKNPEENI